MPSSVQIISNPDLPRPGRRGDLVKFDFKHAYRQQGPICGPCCYCACLNKLLGIYEKVYVNNGGLAGYKNDLK